MKLAEKLSLKFRPDEESIKSMMTDPMTMGSQVMQENGHEVFGMKGFVQMVSEMARKEPASEEKIVADQTKDWEVINNSKE